MAEEIRNRAITEFVADTSGYTKPVEEATKATENLEKSQEKQAEVTKKVTKDNIKHASGFKTLTQQITNMVPGLRDVSRGMKEAEKSAKAFGLGTKTALLATGFGAFVVLIGVVIKKFADLRDKSDADLSFLETKFKSVFSFIGNWIDIATNAWDRFVAAIAPAYAAEKKQFDQAKERAEAQKKINAALLDGAQRELALMEAQRVSGDKLFAQQKKIIDLKLKAGEIDAAQARIEREKLDTDRRVANEERLLAKKKEAFMWETEKHNAHLRLVEELNQTIQDNLDKDAAASAERTNQWQEQQMVQIEMAHERIELAHEEAEAMSQADQVAVEGAKNRIEAQKAVADIFYKSMVGQKLLQMKSALVNAYEAITAVWAAKGVPFLVKLGQSAFVTATTMKQVRSIAGVQFTAPAWEDGGRLPDGGGMIRGRRHYQGGVKFRVGGVVNEAEGGEYIVNRRATARYLPLLESINRKFENGGMVASRTESEFAGLGATIRESARENQRVLVLEDLKRAQTRLGVVESLAKL